LLVEKALELVLNISNPRIMDVGTGSGAIILSLASQLTSGTFIGTDVSRAALKIAQENAHRFGLSQISFLQADLLAPLCGQFDLICANLPYIPRIKMSELQVAKSEPLLALDGGVDGLVLIQKLITQAKSRLAPKGAILLEIEASLGNEALSIVKTTFPHAESKIYHDLAGHDRLLEIRLP
jgi:release factor glutamine methyltransferase